MRPVTRTLAALAALSILGGCTSTQVKDAGGWVAGSLFHMALDIATDGPERRLEERRRRESVPGYEWDPCLRSCEFAAEVARESQIEEARQRKRRIESEEFQAEFDEFMEELNEAERQSGNPPSIIMASE